MQELVAELLAHEVGEVLLNEPLAPYTTWKIGGPADVMVVPSSKEKLAQTVRLLNRSGTPWFLLGRGSNLLVADAGYRGAVIRLGTAFEQVVFDGEFVHAGAALSFIKLSVLAGKMGLTGLEFAGGIPGSVGGAVYMNAGAHGADVSRILIKAEVLLESGEWMTLEQSDLQYAYRHSVLHETRGIVTEALFRLDNGDRKEIAAAMAVNKDRRRRTQPLQQPCAGSTFRNPSGHYAAKLIEDAGLKGYRTGGAEVSAVHANFIVNNGQAKARDVLALIAHIQESVKERFGVELVPEVMKVGEF
ncbi:MAG: UDP-N-acetylenolpyruvoylglucosamine reductase [Paenibacillaceae bacterium]|jgi:UDP-N-acetylmuramate dehydrogenase|nr:UDP-N-acetylenolpyruvoylglucosamine reductase [Paenibacillaceae bacterium]